jgi:hypothetical protein
MVIMLGKMIRNYLAVLEFTTNCRPNAESSKKQMRFLALPVEISTLPVITLVMHSIAAVCLEP